MTQMDICRKEKECLSKFQKELRKKTSFQIYKEYCVGSASFFEFLKYELITFLCGPLAGSIGLFFRKSFYGFLFEKIGKGVLFGKSVNILNPKNITIGNGVIIGDFCSLSAGKNRIELSDNTMISRNTILDNKGGGHLKIGCNSRISFNCSLISASNIEIGKNVLIGGYTYLIGQGHHKFDRTDIPILAQGIVTKGGIIIEDDVYIGAGVKILDGVRIGKGSVIGAGAVVTKSFPSYSIVVGIPAKVINRRK